MNITVSDLIKLLQEFNGDEIVVTTGRDHNFYPLHTVIRKEAEKVSSNGYYEYDAASADEGAVVVPVVVLD